jgi:Uma2 family endonuclease
MPRTAPVRTDLTFEEYLEVEERSRDKHEFVHGKMFGLAGASDRHNRIAGRLYARLLEVETGACRTFVADMKVRTPDGTAYYPDVLVSCDEDGDAYVKRHPCLVVEVLSDSTEAIDRGEKLLNYQKFGSLQGYVLLSQDLPRAEVYRRAEDGWRYEVIEVGETLKLPCVGLELPVDALYEGL